MKPYYMVVPLVIAMGCAHTTMRGTVAMKVSDEEAHVCLGNNEVQTGDTVVLFKNECIGPGKKDYREMSCRKVKLGEGKVVRLLNEHYSVIKVPPTVAFAEGTIVEKQ